MSRRTRVLVVDDSAFARKVMRHVLGGASDLEVVGHDVLGHGAWRVGPPRHPHPLIDRHLCLPAAHILHVSTQVQYATAQAQQPVTQHLHIAFEHHTLNLSDAAARGLHLHLLRLKSTAIPLAHRENFLTDLGPSCRLLSVQLNTRAVHHEARIV